MNPIAALMLTRAIEDERRRVLDQRRPWFSDEDFAYAERLASRSTTRPSRSSRLAPTRA